MLLGPGHKVIYKNQQQSGITKGPAVLNRKTEKKISREPVSTKEIPERKELRKASS